MATRRKPPAAKAAGYDLPAAAGRDDRTEQALARSREIREKGRRQIQAARERVATARRPGPNAGYGPIAQDPSAGLTDAREQIERSRQARADLAALAARLVHTEETVAHIHDEMARRDSRRAAQYRRAAEDARQAACRAREIQSNAAGPDHQ
jgi:hypothetical protein